MAASINFDKLERTTQAVDPDQQAIATEQRAEITPSEGQQGAASSNVATSYETTKKVESFSGAIGNVKRLSVAVLVADKLPPVVAGDSAAAATPPVPEPRSAEELSRIEALVRNALGVDSTRGDVVTVVSAPFSMPVLPAASDTTTPAPTLLAKVQQVEKPLITLIACVTALLIAVLTLKALKPAPPPPAVAAAASNALPAGASGGELAQLASGAEPTDEMAAVAAAPEAPPVLLPPTQINPLREQAIATVDQRPGAAVKVLRNWLRDS
ncbi:MAG: hypothetical protein MUE41_08805 [Gemmatimonadaceae bacterium]|nr:hypothetical protein [Gemmatimonadaceae bacterium]